jgi:hypothetical protein
MPSGMRYTLAVSWLSGQGFVNSGAAGAFDGVTIVEGGEDAETLTDRYAPDGWIDSSRAMRTEQMRPITSSPGASEHLTLSTEASRASPTPPRRKQDVPARRALLQRRS